MDITIFAVPPDFQMWAALVLMVVAIVLYVTEWVSLELTSLGLICALLILFYIAPIPRLGEPGTLGAEDLLAGFSNPALLTVLALLVVGEALVRTGALDSVASVASHPRLGRVGGFLILLIAVAALSAFLNNTPVVVIFIPIIQKLALDIGMSASRVMMPLSFVGILGGMTTLIGSSTNLLVSDTLNDLGQPRLQFFEFTAMGLVMAGAGFIWTIFVVPRVLPERASLARRLARHGQQFISQIIVPEDSGLIGEEAVAGRFENLPDVTVRMIQHGDQVVFPPFEDYKVRSGDLLTIAAARGSLAELAMRFPGHLHPPREAGGDRSGERLRRSDTNGEENGSGAAEAGETAQIVAEAMVTPSSRMVGLTLEQYGFHQRYRCVVIGILRRAAMIRAKMPDIRLEAGDVLLVQGRQRELDVVRRERDLVIISGTADVLQARDKAGVSALIFIVAVGLAALGLVPIVVAAFAAATALIAIGAINLRQAARAIDRKIVLVIAAALALSAALYHTGAAIWLAQTMLGLFGGATPLSVLSVFFLLVALLTNILSNNACAVLFTPIGFSLGQELGVDPRIFAITVVLAANCSFATPIGYKTNLLVMGPGQYVFLDFIKAGLPLVLLMWVVFTLIAPMFWPAFG